MKGKELPVNEYGSYYQTYIDTVVDTDLLTELQEGKTRMVNFINNLPESKLIFSYAPEKWSLSQVIVHIMDVERVFQYRALRFARNDKTNVAGFDDEMYALESRASTRSKESLANEFEAVRDSSITLFNSFDDEVLKRYGYVMDIKTSVRALGFILCGHLRHHVGIINERYLK